MRDISAAVEQLSRCLHDEFVFQRDPWSQQLRMVLHSVYHANGGTWACSFALAGTRERVRGFEEMPIWSVMNLMDAGLLTHVPSNGVGGVL